MPFLTEVKQLLEISNTDYDSLLGDIIEGVVSSADEEMCAKYSLVTSKTEYFDGGVSTIYLAYVNVSNLTFSVDGTELVEGRTEEYVLYPEIGVVKCSTEDGFAEGLRIITAVYDGGYAEDSYPTSLYRKLIKQMAHEFRRRKDSGLSSMTHPDGSVQKYTIDKWLSDVQRELNNHKRIFL